MSPHYLIQRGLGKDSSIHSLSNEEIAFPMNNNLDSSAMKKHRTIE